MPPASVLPSADQETAAQAAVVIPCYNARRWIADAIETALAQGPAQVIVIDDGSSDDSLEAIKAFGDRVLWRSGPNRGGNAARNQGLALVTVPYVVFLDADDLLEGRVLAGGVARAEEGADLVFSEMETRYPDGRSHSRGPFGPPGETPRDLFRTWFRSTWVNPSATLWRVSFLRDIGGWDETVPINQDGEVVMRALMRGARVARNGEGRGIRRIDNPESVSRSVNGGKLARHLEMMEQMVEGARDAGFGAELDGIGFNTYQIARTAFLAGHLQTGRRATALLAHLGDRRHHGPWRHRLLAGLLGLERKIRLLGR